MNKNDIYTKSDNGIYLPKNYTFFNKPTDYDMSVRKLEACEQTAKFVQWGRKNPALFAEKVFGIKMLDYQKYIFTESWSKPYVVWCMSRNGGKSILGSIFLMTKCMLIPMFKAYILCSVGSQSIEMFTKLEQLTKRQIASFEGFSNIFYDEVVKGGNSDGFIHNPASYQMHLYNNSYVFTLNGSFDNNRSK